MQKKHRSFLEIFRSELEAKREAAGKKRHFAEPLDAGRNSDIFLLHRESNDSLVIIPLMRGGIRTGLLGTERARRSVIIPGRIRRRLKSSDMI